MPTLTKLDPIQGLEFNEEQHVYTFNGKPVPASVTSICSFDMDDRARERIESTRDDWEPRGNHLHAMCEQWWLGAAQLDPGPYAEWSDALFDHPLFKNYSPLAVEHRFVDKRGRYAGSCDFIIQGPGKDGKDRVLLCDLKTKRSTTSKVGDHRKQLGAYVRMCNQHYPTLIIDKCVIVNSFPGRVDLTVHDPDECVAAWDEQWGKYEAWQPAF